MTFNLYVLSSNIKILDPGTSCIFYYFWYIQTVKLVMWIDIAREQLPEHMLEDWLTLQLRHLSSAVELEAELAAMLDLAAIISERNIDLCKGRRCTCLSLLDWVNALLLQIHVNQARAWSPHTLSRCCWPKAGYIICGELMGRKSMISPHTSHI